MWRQVYNMEKNILITGGCGFIGRSLTERLIKNGNNVTIVDNISQQIHGPMPDLSWLKNEKITFIKGDVCDYKQIADILSHNTIIIHLAAETGTAQSMYNIRNCVNVNVFGTSCLMEALINENHNVEKVILASSRAVYGEGKYNCPCCGNVFPLGRLMPNLEKFMYDPLCPTCSGKITPIPSDEKVRLEPVSIYGVTKLTQENIIKTTCMSLGIPYTILRFQNIYGPGQSLINSYTGIFPVFISQILQERRLLIFEDGLESRDFIHVYDVISSIISTIGSPKANNQIFNVGSGVSYSILDIAKLFYKYLDKTENYQITKQYRKGDIRHSLADISHIKEQLDFVPCIKFENGIQEFIAWALKQSYLANDFEQSINILKGKGLYSR